MLSRRKAVVALWLAPAWVLSGCFDPDLGGRPLACAFEGDECPGDYRCIDDLCYPPGQQPGGPNPDGGGAGPGDPPGGDAGAGDPDARVAVGAWSERSGPAGEAARSLAFSSAHGWIVSNFDRIWRSDDEGATWSDHGGGIPAPLAVAAAPDQSAWLLADSDDRVWVSSSGDAFVTVADTPGERLGVIGAASRERAALGSLTGERIYTTEDGGASWIVHEFDRSLLPGVDALSVAGDVIVAGGGLDFSTGARRASLAVSRNFGESWKAVDLEDRAHDREGGPIAAVFASPMGEIWAAGPSRQLYYSADGGVTFTQIGGIPERFGDLQAVAADGVQVVTAGTYDHPEGRGIAIYESLDGGATWAIGHLDPCGCDVGGAAVGPDGTIWVYASSGALLTRRFP